jgi:hypothetical protein
MGDELLARAPWVLSPPKTVVAASVGVAASLSQSLDARAAGMPVASHSRCK